MNEKDKFKFKFWIIFISGMVTGLLLGIILMLFAIISKVN